MDRAEGEEGEVEGMSFRSQVSGSTLGEVIVVEDRLDGQCMRHVHLMANEAIEDAILHPYGISPTTANFERGQAAGTHYVKAVTPFRGVWNVDAACGEGKRRRLVVWSLAIGGQRWMEVREGARCAAVEFERRFGFASKYVFVRRLPKGAENCMEVEGMILLEAEWMVERAVAVGGRRTPPLTPPQIQRANLERGE